MARGYPDFGVSEVFGEAFTPTDIGEIATRQGSIVTYDRRGLVVDLDDFETPILKWDIGRENVLCTAILDSTTTRSLAQAVKLHTRDVANSYIWLARTSPVPSHRRLGLETSFSKLSANCYIEVQLAMDDATRVYYGCARANPQTGDVYIESPAGNFVPVGNMGIMYQHDFSINTMKLVMDFTTMLYVRLIANMDEFPIPAYPLSTGLSLGRRNLTYVLRQANKAALGGDGWVDDAILTKDEP